MKWKLNKGNNKKKTTQVKERQTTTGTKEYETIIFFKYIGLNAITSGLDLFENFVSETLFGN